MNISFYIPPAVEDVGLSAGYLIRCKPANDCASLFGPDTTTLMYTMLGRAFRDAQAHAKTCAHDHAVVAIARGPVSVRVGEQASSRAKGAQVTREDSTEAAPAPTEPRQMMVPRDGGSVHAWLPDCEHGCVPVAEWTPTKIG